MFLKNPGYAAIILSIPALWTSGLLVGLESGEQLPAFEDWFLVANLVFTVLAAISVVFGLIMLIRES